MKKTSREGLRWEGEMGGDKKGRGRGRGGVRWEGDGIGKG